MTEENIEYIDAYIFMTYENMLKTLEKKRLKVLFPEECNDPFEFMSAPPTKLPDGYTSFDSTHLRKEYGFDQPPVIQRRDQLRAWPGVAVERDQETAVSGKRNRLAVEGERARVARYLTDHHRALLCEPRQREV